jgi:hypothetical protein
MITILFFGCLLFLSKSKISYSVLLIFLVKSQILINFTVQTPNLIRHENAQSF